MILNAQIRKFKPFVVLLMLVFGVIELSACANMPKNGPGLSDFNQKNKRKASNDAKSVEANLKYNIVEVDKTNISLFSIDKQLENETPLSYYFKSEANSLIQIGDKIQIDIWESSADGLFTTSQNKQTKIDTILDRDGKIFVPYVGRIQAVGRSSEQLRTSIVNGLHGLAVNPQVLVTITSRQLRNISLLGDFSKPGEIEAPLGGIKLMEAISMGGGSKYEPFETKVSFVRNGKTFEYEYDKIISNPENNIWLNPKDILILRHHYKTYTLVGAVRSQSLQKFPSKSMSLSEALLQGGGLDGNISSSGGVFIFRNVDKANGVVLPTIYRLDFGKPEGLFFATNFKVYDKDLIYVARAPSTEIQNFLSAFVAPIVSVGSSVKSVAQ